MNFLAHSILSPNEPLVMLGNLSGDFVKGTKFSHLHPKIEQGVRIHRKIDEFTDNHELVREAKKIVRSKFGLFSGIVIDMFWDHFVAQNHLDLNNHVDYVYDSAELNFEVLPDKFKPVFPIMKKYDWLSAYGDFEGLRMIMLQMRNRIGNKSPLDEAVDILIQEQKQLSGLFQLFWKDVLKEQLY